MTAPIALLTIALVTFSLADSQTAPIAAQAEEQSGSGRTDVRLRDQTITLVPAAGFAYLDASETAAIEQKLPITIPSNRLLSLSVPVEMVGSISALDLPNLSRYGSAQIVKKLEPLAALEVHLDKLRTLSGVKTTLSDEKCAEVAALIKKRLNVDLSISAESAGRLLDEKGYFTDLHIIRNRPEGDAEERVVASTMTVALVKGSIITLYLFTPYESDADVQWLKSTTKEMVESTLAAND